MKYKHILNGEVLFETEYPSDFVKYMLTDPRASQAKYSVLYRLLSEAKEYECKMVSGTVAA